MALTFLCARSHQAVHPCGVGKVVALASCAAVGDEVDLLVIRTSISHLHRAWYR